MEPEWRDHTVAARPAMRDEDVSDDVTEGHDGAALPAVQDRGPNSGQGTEDQRGQGATARAEHGTDTQGREGAHGDRNGSEGQGDRDLADEDQGERSGQDQAGLANVGERGTVGEAAGG